MFARYTQPTRLNASPVYGKEDFLKPLVSTSLRELTCDQIGRYAGKALTTVGTVSDYKHFLPRLLEHAVAERCPYMGLDPKELAERLIYGGWSRWPDGEREAVLSVMHLAADQSANEPPDTSEAEAWQKALSILT